MPGVLQVCVILAVECVSGRWGLLRSTSLCVEHQGTHNFSVSMAVEYRVLDSFVAAGNTSLVCRNSTASFLRLAVRSVMSNVECTGPIWRWYVSLRCCSDRCKSDLILARNWDLLHDLQTNKFFFQPRSIWKKVLKKGHQICVKGLFRPMQTPVTNVCSPRAPRPSQWLFDE